MAKIQRIILDVAMLDGTEHTDVAVVVADRMKLSEVARRHKWGGLDTDPDRGMTFLAYAALSRRGLFSGTFDDFVNAAEVVAPQEDAVDVDPTVTAIPAV